ncbi:MAG: hypothetical protein U5L11_12640 [Arhodomonas sp.]|nr:hypothetical protein [Arhodomonas sp.]
MALSQELPTTEEEDHETLLHRAALRGPHRLGARRPVRDHHSRRQLAAVQSPASRRRPQALGRGRGGGHRGQRPGGGDELPLGPPPPEYDLVSDGLADVGFAARGYTPGRFSVFELAELPLQTPSSEELSVAYWRAYQETMAGQDEHKGVHLLGLFVHGPGHIWNSQRPVDSLDDLQGLKLRVPGGVAAQLSENLGVTPINAPSSQAYELLSQGVADGIVFPYESVTFFNLQETLEYGTTVPGGLYNVSFYVVMNEDKWNAPRMPSVRPSTVSPGSTWHG